ncbi:MAG TPA: lactate utilization protein C [Kribbellaceae bacterium]
MNARDEILGRIRAALADVPPGSPDDEPVPRDYRRAHHDAGVVDLFAERVADYRATVRRVAATDLPVALAEELSGKVVVVPADVPAGWTGGHGAAPDDPAGAGEAGFVVRPDDPALSVAELDAVDAVLTGCALGIAETGTIVLDAGAAQGRRALTLVPDVHVCVVREDQVVADVPEAVAALDPLRPLTWISGPSATSDIELERVEGVHGPRTLVVLLVS